VRFLADESCDFAAVTALRAAGHDVVAVVDLAAGADDDRVLALAREESRVLLTEDKDFGVLAYARGEVTSGVILIRFRADARRTLGADVVKTVTELGDRLRGAFITLEPGRARVSPPRPLTDK
jgi:predicted nuclease of predicted toxin-antitoxin system